MKGIGLENNNKIEKSIPVSLLNIHKVRIIDKSQNGDGRFCIKCKNLLKYDDISKEKFCPNCEQERLIEIKNHQRIQNRKNDGRNVRADNAEDTVFLYIDDIDFTCKLQFNFKKNEKLDIIEKNKKMVDNIIKTTARIKMTYKSSNNYFLEIKGQGYDNRCRWCKYYRNVLAGKLKIEYQKRCRYNS